MFNPAIKIILKIVELIGCIACVIVKVLTDRESKMVALRNQKFSREWSLLNNVTWSREGNAFANITYGGYTLITSLLLLTRIIDIRQQPNLMEKVFLTVGMLFFFAMGGLVFASLEQVPVDLHDNALILGALSFFVAIIFLIDLSDSKTRKISTTTQTDESDNNNKVLQKEVNQEILAKIQEPYVIPSEKVSSNLQRHEQPVFGKILIPEKQRPVKQKMPKLNYSKESLLIAAENVYAFDNQNFNLLEQSQKSQEEAIDNPSKVGFVARAARIWDKRARKSSELSTVV